MEDIQDPCSVPSQTCSVIHAAFLSLPPSIGFLLLQESLEIAFSPCPSAFNILFLAAPLHLCVAFFFFFLLCNFIINNFML